MTQRNAFCSDGWGKFLIGCAVGVVFIFICGLVAYFARPRPTFEEAVQLLRTVYALSQSHHFSAADAGAVPLQRLIDGGYLDSKHARHFRGSTIMLLPQDDNVTRPQTAIVRLIVQDGREFAMMADGTVHQLHLLNVSGPAKESVSVGTNNAIVLRTASGARAVIHFTAFEERKATYRWRYAGLGAPRTSGVGTVSESYHSNRRAEGKYALTPKYDHDPIVRAGDIRIEWSYASLTNAWLYYDPNRAKVELIDWKAVDVESEPLPPQ